MGETVERTKRTEEKNIIMERKGVLGSEEKNGKEGKQKEIHCPQLSSDT